MFEIMTEKIFKHVRACASPRCSHIRAKTSPLLTQPLEEAAAQQGRASVKLVNAILVLIGKQLWPDAAPERVPEGHTLRTT